MKYPGTVILFSRKKKARSTGGIQMHLVRQNMIPGRRLHPTAAQKLFRNRLSLRTANDNR
jgi:hypothetical protein